jgi:hypothetical protein
VTSQRWQLRTSQTAAKDEFPDGAVDCVLEEQNHPFKGALRLSDIRPSEIVVALTKLG